MASKTGSTAVDIDIKATELGAKLGNRDFVAVVRALECLYPDKPRLGTATRIADEYLRLSQRANLGFKGTTLDGLEPHKGKQEWRLFCNFQGLFGSNGPLPLHYTEYADRRSRHNIDETFYEFVDFFNHRLLSLFYRASADYDPVINADRPGNNAFENLVASLAGLGPLESRNRDQYADMGKFFHASWFGRQVKSPDGLQAVIKQYFKLKVKISEFVGEWLLLPASAKLRLGGDDGNFLLGQSAYLGKRVWTIGDKFRVTLGPLEWADYASFEPDSQRAIELYVLIRNYAGDQWDWEVELVLRQNQRQEMLLDGSRRLGFNSWLGRKGKEQQNDSVQKTTINRNVLVTSQIERAV